MHAALQKLRRILLEETAADTAAYVVGFKTWHQAKNGLIVGLIVVFIGLFTIGQKAPLLMIPGLISLYVVVWAVLFFRYNPRLNYEGQVFKEKWLGFKLYLETAEKYRLQILHQKLLKNIFRTPLFLALRRSGVKPLSILPWSHQPGIGGRQA